MLPVFCHFNRSTFIPACPSPLSFPSIGRYCFHLHHGYLCNCYFLCRFYHRETGGKQKVPMGTPCRHPLFCRITCPFYLYEIRRWIILQPRTHYAHPLCRRRYARWHAELNIELKSQKPGHIITVFRFLPVNLHVPVSSDLFFGIFLCHFTFLNQLANCSLLVSAKLFA